ncbi:insulinase family protein [Massilia atriviolacea]|uniref:Insulinase family protein n=1 Tax=Massilia atriviolacea TaxID=2495579 RepID=A0A430HIJ5_9BURK|nr:M16 family metallopeptidase [Massilia atriviolacea]RSZ57325.1 insulinase family protein [Massilia atriviolacea]
MSKYFVRSAGAAALLLAFALNAAAAIRLDDAIPVGPQVKVGKLANGLTYYIQKNARPEKKLELRLVVKAGSILEDEDQLGLAHFTEHMAFNGSTNFKKHELVSYLQSIGVKFGADLNAYTSFDETVYILPIPTDNRDNIDKGFLVLQDWAGGLTMNAADIDKERGIVLEELRLGKGAADRMNKVLMPKLYNGSRYAQRMPIGKEHVIEGFKHDAIRRFYKDWYRPDLMAVVAVGDIDPLDAERRIRQHFGHLKNPARPRARTYAAIPTRAHTEALVVTDREASSNALLIRYPVKEAIDKGTFGAYREKLVEALFTGMLGQRMQELAQQANPPFIAGSSSVGKLTARYTSFTASAALGKGGAVPAIEALVQENARTRQFGFSAQEFERARKNMMRQYELAYNERDKTDSGRYVGEYVRNFLEQESIPGIENEYGYVRELLPSITLDEMNRYARATIPAPAASAKLVVYMGSAKEDSPAPSSAQLLAAVAAAEKVTVHAQEQKTLAAELMDKPPAGGSIVAQSEDKALGLTRLTLSNGVKVILKPTDFRNDQVLMSAARFGGQTLFGDADIVNARYANAVVGTMGLKDYSPLDLQKILAGKAATVSLTLGNHVDGVTGSAANDDIETMLQLVYLRMTGVRRDEGLYKSYVGKQVEAARNAMAQPESVFRDTLVSTMYQDHPRVGRTARPADFDKLDLERALAVYRARFFSARDMTFILVGSFDMDKVKPLLATYLGALPVGEIEAGYKDVGVRPVRGVVKKEVRSGTEAKSSISLNFSGEAPYSDDEAMRFQAMLEVINIRITDILREKLGLIYGGGMSGSLTRYPYENYLVTASLPTGPANVDKVIAATMAEIGRMKEQGPDLADLNKVKQNWLQNHQKALRENGYWLNRLQSAQLQGSDPAEILAYPQKVAAITPAQLKQAAQRYFDMNNYVQLVLYPENK